MRNIMKAALSAGLSLTCLAFSAGCGSGGVIGSKNGANSKATKIVLVAKQEGIPWFDDMRSGVKQFSEDNKGKVDVKQIAPDSGDSAKQVQMVSDLISQQVDAIVVVPNDPQALKPVIKQAKAKGIVVVSHEASNIADDVDYDIEAFKNEDFGVAFCKPLAENMGGKGKLAAVVGSKTMETHMAWYRACKSMMEKDYPNIQFVSSEPYEDNNNDDTARKVATEILNAHPDITGFFGTSVSAGSNMAAVLKERSNRNVYVSTLGIPSVDMPYIQDDWVRYAQTWRPKDAGYAALQLAYDKVQGKKIASGIDLKAKGYEKSEVKGHQVYGDAPLILKKGDYKDGKYPF